MGVLLMLMTIGGLIVAAIIFIVSSVTKNKWLRSFTLGGVAVWFVFYAVMLIGFSFASKEETLGMGEAKEYCGFYLDCHMHTAVNGVRIAKMLGNKTAKGIFYVVDVKVFSNARRATLALIDVDASVVDENGRSYSRDIDAESSLPPQASFENKLPPMQSFVKQIVFDLPADVREPRLDLREGYGIDHVIEAVLVDDEDSILHKRKLFQLQEQSDTEAVK